MELLKKEAGIIELTLQGNQYGTLPFVRTDYSYELVVDPIINKPAFILRSETRILFSDEDYILYKGYVVYVFDHTEGTYITGEDLWKVTVDGRNSMNRLLQRRLHALPAARQISLSALDHEEEIDTLERLIITGLRLN